MTETPAPIEDRAANIKDVVLHIITSKQDEMFDAFDRLHRRNIHDDDVVAALRTLGEEDLLDAYAEWGDIDIREDDNTTTNPVVPDPADAPSYASHPLNVQSIHDYPIQPGFPLPSDRNALQYEIDQLQKEYIGKFHTDPVFHAKAKMAANFLDQLESVHQLGDSEHAGFLLVALLEKSVTA
jgi:hypothetical protein